MIDKKEFFREATLRICGSLEIEEAMQSVLLLMRKVMPLDRMYLEFYDQEFKSMRVIASSTAKESRKLNDLVPLSLEAQKLAGISNLPDDKDVFIFEHPMEQIVSREMLQFLNVSCNSLMIMVLKSKDQLLGVLVLISENDSFKEADAELLSNLKEPFAIAMSNALEHMEVQKLQDLLADDNRYLRGELHRLSGDEIVGANFGLRNVMHHMRQVAPLDSPVLLSGETGVGKDVIANAIHYSSSRSKGPFISVNCGAIPVTLIDSELFGHEKGAFTGAINQKRGRFERAHNGTIFLDEIGELPPDAQVRLLRVLQTKEIERVGGTDTISLDIRIIAATNRNLQEEVTNGNFREDLWFRLNVFPIWIPPLRDRKADIPALLQHFLGLKSRELKLSDVPSVLPDSMDLIMEYQWPGNVRELQNVIERALILNPTGPLKFEGLIQSSDTKVLIPDENDDMNDHLDSVITRHIKHVLNKTGGKIHGSGGAAERLGVNPNTLRNRMNKLGIVYKRSARS